jgi:ABC-type molybdate transport system substrate-binding protein
MSHGQDRKIIPLTGRVLPSIRGICWRGEIDHSTNEEKCMSKIKLAKESLALALDADRSPKERLAALKRANDLRSELKVGWPKLDAPEGFNMAAYLDELKVAKADAPREQKAPKKEPDPNRGAIGRLVESDLDYAAIEARVKEAHPEANTTRRSIASVAADLRRDGVDVKSRRKAAAAKSETA